MIQNIQNTCIYIASLEKGLTKVEIIIEFRRISESESCWYEQLPWKCIIRCIILLWRCVLSARGLLGGRRWESSGVSPEN